MDAVLSAVAVTEPVILVVHDTGGMVGTAWAAANLDRVRGMVITNTVAFEGFPWFPIARQWGDTSLYGKIRSSLGLAALRLRGGALFKARVRRAVSATQRTRTGAALPGRSR